MAVGKIRRTVTAVLVVIVLIVGTVAGLYFAGYIGKKEARIDSTTIANSFEDIAELATQKYAFTDVGTRSDEGVSVFGWRVPLSGKSFLLTYSGTVTAGIKDLSSVQVEIKEPSQRVIVTLPSPEVLNAQIDPASVVVYDQSFNPFNPNSVDDVTTFLAEETEKNKQEAVDGGLLDLAKEQATTLAVAHVKAILLSTDMNEYDIIVNFE